eukprot:gnl/Chilomastix_caulleri/703.p1 GENE.gnl/Chilomastix_caulleri/703~~gnl/Chilomastix_caulleri/703.p1  ORF type:complete len:124 (+),score=20.58 gnl/Chilomastix_caulleri/703:72-443(+)
MNAVEERQEKALSVFRKPPVRYNCSQSTLHAFEDDIKSGKIKTTESYDELFAKASKYAGGNGPDGYCGALLSAIMIKPDMEDTFVAEFDKEALSHKCREIRAADHLKCEGCVKLATKLVTEQL